jgi:16S rRNA G1207 methylase RsmC
VATSAKSAGGRVVLEDFGCGRGMLGSRVYENGSLVYKHMINYDHRYVNR